MGKKNKARDRLPHINNVERDIVEKILSSEKVTTRKELASITGKRDVYNRTVIRAISWDRAVLFTGGYRYPKPIEKDENNEDYKAVCRDIATLNHYIEALKMRLRPMIAYKKQAEKMKPELKK